MACALGMTDHLLDQRAVPDPEEQFLELCELRRPELGAPFALDVPENLVNPGVCGASARRQVYDSAAPFVRRVGPGEVSESLQALEQLVHRLLAHAGPFGEQSRADAIG